jgi:hypothetical protein
MRLGRCSGCGRRQTVSHDRRMKSKKPYSEKCKAYNKLPYNQQAKMKIRAKY